LALRARDRNPDEFYFGMVNAKTRDGVHQGKPQGSKVYSADEMKLLRTQDAGYVEMKRAHEEKVAAAREANRWAERAPLVSAFCH
jgi:U3 small nucleolar RNA-associated protein 11